MSLPTSLDWLTTRPIAHRGLHDAAHGVIENTAGAVRAAVDGHYGLEVDVQVSSDGEAMVHHDDVLGRLTDGAGRLDGLTAAELKRVPFRGSDQRIMTLGDLCDLIAGRATLLVEMKSRFDGDPRLPLRVATVLAGYRGPAAPMSFDPGQLLLLRQKSRDLVLGIIAAKYRPHPYWDLMPGWMRYGMGYLLTAVLPRPQFVAYAVGSLPALAPLVANRLAGVPLLTWTVRTERERRTALRWADQMIFEGFRP